MKMKIGIYAILLVSVVSYAGSLNPPADPAPTMKTLDEVEPRIAINDENTPGDPNSTYIISEPGSYYLTGNFTCTTKHGILIDADDVTVDLMGYRIWCSYSKPPENDGIHITADHKNINIKNGTIASDRSTAGPVIVIRGFLHGIYAESGNQGITIKNICINDSRDAGIWIDYSSCNKVEDCTILNNDNYGMYLGWGAYSSVVKNNIVKGNGESGIACGIGSLVSDNVVEYNSDGLIANYNSIIINNTVSYNTGDTDYSTYGIWASEGCTVKCNTISFNGIESDLNVWGLNAGEHCIIQGNNIRRNGYQADADVRGINAGAGCTIIENSVCDNGPNSTGTGYGIYTSDYCLVDKNTAYLNHGTNLYTGTGSVLGTNLAP